MKKNIIKLLILSMFISNFSTSQIRAKNENDLIAETTTPILIAAVVGIIAYFKKHPNDWQGLKNLISRKKQAIISEVEITKTEKKYDPMQIRKDIEKIKHVFENLDNSAKTRNPKLVEQAATTIADNTGESYESLIDELQKPSIHEIIAKKLGLEPEALQESLKSKNAGVFKDGEIFYKVIAGEIIPETLNEPTKYIETTRIPSKKGFYTTPSIIEFDETKKELSIIDPSTIQVKRDIKPKSSTIKEEIPEIHSQVALKLSTTPTELQDFLINKKVDILQHNNDYYRALEGKIISPISAEDVTLSKALYKPNIVKFDPNLRQFQRVTESMVARPSI